MDHGRTLPAVAWTLVGALVAFTGLGMLSIGPLLLPVAVCLLIASVVRETRRVQRT